jgi:hypothetical protein
MSERICGAYSGTQSIMRLGIALKDKAETLAVKTKAAVIVGNILKDVQAPRKY